MVLIKQSIINKYAPLTKLVRQDGRILAKLKVTKQAWSISDLLYGQKENFL